VGFNESRVPERSGGSSIPDHPAKPLSIVVRGAVKKSARRPSLYLAAAIVELKRRMINTALHGTRFMG
jgi:hypothetical protein